MQLPVCRKYVYFMVGHVHATLNAQKCHFLNPFYVFKAVDVMFVNLWQSSQKLLYMICILTTGL